MLSVLILGLFEMMTDTTPRAMKAWHNHVNGAIELAKLRNVSQFRTKSGIKMFLMLCQSVTISSMQRDAPMPQTLIEMRNQLAPFLDPRDVTWKVSEPIYKLLQVRSDMKQGMLTNPEVIAETLITIDGEINDLILSFPKSWWYRVVRIKEPHPLVCGEMVHIYPNLHLPLIWNALRCCRTIILETILSEIYTMFQTTPSRLISDRWDTEFENTKVKLEQICEAMVASVPQQIGVLASLKDDIDSQPSEWPIINQDDTRRPVSRRSRSTSPTTSTPDSAVIPARGRDGQRGPTLANSTRSESSDQEAQRFMVLASSTNAIAWPMYNLTMSSGSTPEMKAYAIEQLRSIYANTGIKQAKAITELAENHDSSDMWLQEPLRVGSSPHAQETDRVARDSLRLL
jgi:hypothetical protein